MNCQTCQSALPDLLFDPTSALSVSVREHLDSCPACKKEFASYQVTFALLDTWKAPEPSPYFDQKLAVLLREEQEKAPAGWFERLKTSLLLNTGRQFRPAMMGAMALVLLLGGGTYAGISTLTDHQPQVQASAAVDDLQILDKNDQALQQMEQILQDADATNDGVQIPQS